MRKIILGFLAGTLRGDESFTLAELAAEITRQTGTEITYRDLPVEEYTRVLLGRPTTTLAEALQVAIQD